MSAFEAPAVEPADADDRKFGKLCKYCARAARFRCDHVAHERACHARLCEIHAQYLGGQRHRCLSHKQ